MAWGCWIETQNQDSPAASPQQYTQHMLSQLSHAKLHQPFGKSFTSTHYREGGVTPNKIFIEADFFLIFTFAKEMDAFLNKAVYAKQQILG